MEIEVKLMLKYYLIFKILLFQSIFINAQDSTADYRSSSSEQASFLKKDKQKPIYPGKPLVMSLVVPGAGQFYNQSPVWKTALFFGTEIVSLLAWRNFKNTADKYRKNYQSFADDNWSLDNWVFNRFDSVIQQEWSDISSLGSLNGTHDLRLVVSGNLANDLNIFGHISSDSLEKHPEWFYSGDVTEVRDRHFYENIGKYDQFVGGWTDARDNWYQEEKNVGDSTEIVIKTPFKQSYIDDRYDANQMLDYAKYSITILMFNHVISGIESVWYSQKKASEELENTSNFPTRINLVFNPQNPMGIGGLEMAWCF
tara:strand:- start:52 stop:987 length:936 start_codon:yes stop_codon:yes gene_type:complete